MIGGTEFGANLKTWRRRRRMSQLELACEADISTRHLSFVETGRANPSREMVVRLAEHLRLPPRETNRLLTAAGFAPARAERALDDPAMAAARGAVEILLRAHEPFPALAVDRHWMLRDANRAARRLMGGAPASGPVNALKAGLDPDGLGAMIVNYGQWRAHILERLDQQIDASGDPVLIALREELAGFRAPPARGGASSAGADLAGLAVPFVLRTEAGVLSFFSTTTVFGTPVDVTLSEIAIETFLPADAFTAEAMRRLAAEP